VHVTVMRAGTRRRDQSRTESTLLETHARRIYRATVIPSASRGTWAEGRREA
jgi:hypothetical protein